MARLKHVDQTLVRPDLEMLLRVLIDEGRAHNREPLDPRRKRNRSSDLRAGALGRLNDIAG